MREIKRFNTIWQLRHGINFFAVKVLIVFLIQYVKRKNMVSNQKSYYIETHYRVKNNLKHFRERVRLLLFQAECMIGVRIYRFGVRVSVNYSYISKEGKANKTKG